MSFIPVVTVHEYYTVPGFVTIINPESIVSVFFIQDFFI